MRGKVDFGVESDVDVIGPGIERDVLDDLQQFGVAIAGGPDGLDIGLADLAAVLRDEHGKAHGGIGLDVVGPAAAIGGDFGIVEFDEVLAGIGVVGEAVVAAMQLGDGQCDALAGRQGQRPFRQCFEEAQVPLQYRRAIADQAKEVRQPADPALHRFQQRPRCGRCVFDLRDNGNA